jgi:hypothetical protein
MLIPLGVYSQGRVEEVIYITQSTTKGIYLDNVYNNMTNKSPRSAKSVKFIVSEGVEIIGPNTTTAAIESGNQWSSDVKLVVENRGRVIGRGGSGGDGGTGLESYKVVTINGNNYPDRYMAVPFGPKNGGDGGPAINGSFHITVRNYGLIAGGGGGGAGGVYYPVNVTYSNGATFRGSMIHGASGGGGAPYGKGIPNPTTVEYLFSRVDWLTGIDAVKANHMSVSAPSGYVRFNLEFFDPKRVQSGVRFNAIKATSAKASILEYQWVPNTTSAYIPQTESMQPARFMYTTPNSSDPSTYTTPQILRNNASSSGTPFNAPGKHGSDGTATTGGSGGYCFFKDSQIGNDIDITSSLTSAELQELLPRIPENKAGSGGDIGMDGTNAIQAWYMINPGGYYGYSGEYAASPHFVLSSTPPDGTSSFAQGGKAGYVKSGDVTITNLNGGTTKGR